MPANNSLNGRNGLFAKAMSALKKKADSAASDQYRKAAENNAQVARTGTGTIQKLPDTGGGGKVASYGPRGGTSNREYPGIGNREDEISQANNENNAFNAAFAPGYGDREEEIDKLGTSARIENMFGDNDGEPADNAFDQIETVASNKPRGHARNNQDLYDQYVAQRWGGSSPYGDNVYDFQLDASADDYWDWAKFAHDDIGMYDSVIDWSLDEDAAKEAFLNDYFYPNEQKTIYDYLADGSGMSNLVAGDTDIYQYANALAQDENFAWGNMEGGNVVSDTAEGDDLVDAYMNGLTLAYLSDMERNGRRVGANQANALMSNLWDADEGDYGFENGRLAYGRPGSGRDANYTLLSNSDNIDTATMLAAMDSINPTNTDLWYTGDPAADRRRVLALSDMYFSPMGLGSSMTDTERNDVYVPYINNDLFADYSTEQSSEKEK